MLNGSTRDEEQLFAGVTELQSAPITAANYQARIASRLGVSAAVAAKIVREYPLARYRPQAARLAADVRGTAICLPLGTAKAQGG